MFKPSFVVTLLMASLWTVAGQYGDIPHYDHRSTPHLQFNPPYQAKAALTGEARAYDFLAANAATYGANINNLVLMREQASLLAMHYHYGQMLDGYPVLGGEIVVSIDHETGKIGRVYNNIFPESAQAPSLAPQLLEMDDAYDVSWQNLSVRGELLAAPEARLAFLPVGKEFRLIWMVNLHTAKPAGDWETMLDATNGKVLSVEDKRVSRLPTTGKPDEYRGPIYDRAATFAAYELKARQREAELESHNNKASLVDGSGLVFDPDPRTTLNDETLQDSSPASAFTAAYITRTLSDITQTGGTFSLVGPWINILDWDPPTNAPSTTNDGNWTAVRGDNAFNDATTYFHIHQSQVYIQSLGFTGSTGIQEGSIGTDTDGADGADNSYYTSGANRMAFGHGCVDDNEDADVILHEYGHAIHYSINNNWGGGDAGAIGEGFGDYWAGSYSYSTPNGPVFHPEWIFSWDGHSNCWGGRFLNKTTMMYDPNQSYGAHQSIPGGQSDELWSAPVFSSFLDLIGMGRPREEIDQIVLESHFGLGSGVTMRILANSTVAAAGALQPGGPHASVFTNRFLAQNILDLPHVTVAASDLVIDSEPGGNGVADPGETVDLQLRLLNSGNLLASSVTGTLTSSNPAVTINTAVSAYPDLGIGATAANATAFSITLDPSLECGASVVLQLEVDWVDASLAPGNTTVSFTLNTGVAEGLSESSMPALAIPDNTTVQDVITTAAAGTVSANFNLDVDITHTYIGDLIITLRAPDGTDVILHNGSGGATANIVGNYPGTLTPEQPLSVLTGKALAGDWTLIISDGATNDTGILNSWTLNDVSGYTCDTAVVPCYGDLNGDLVVDDADYAIVMEGWSTPAGSLDGSGLATIFDMMNVKLAYGDCN